MLLSPPTMQHQHRVLKNFIVLEGLDGAGTTTQMERLAARLEQHGARVMATCEPSTGEAGLLARRILKREVKVDPRTLALVFAADRNEHLYGENGMLSHLDGGEIVVCDRYLFSSLAYQSVGCSYQLVAELNRPFPLPEYLIFLDVAPRETQRRLSTRSDVELFDGSSIQEQILENYERGMAEFNVPEMHQVRIDGNQSIETVSEKIWSALQSLPIQRV